MSYSISTLLTRNLQDVHRPTVSLTFALPVSFAAVRRRILNAVNAGSGEKAWVKTLPLV